MNSKELTDSLIRQKKGPRMGAFDNPWIYTLEAWVEQGYPVANNEPVKPAAHFGFDMESAGGWFDFLPIEGYSEIIAETDEWKIVRNGAGASMKYWKHKAGTPEHIDFRMTSREIWERDYRSRIKINETRIKIERIKKALESVRKRGIWAYISNMGLWEIMRQSMGDICMFETLLLDPEWVLDFNRVYTDFYKGLYTLLFDKIGLPDGVWLCDDLAYKNGLFCSADLLNKLFAPFYREIADFFHSYDLPVVFHCCGFMEKAAPMIAECGFDALNPMEIKAGCDPLRLARQYRDKLAFIGGLDARILESGRIDYIIRESDKLINGMREIGAAFFFGSDHSVSTNVKLSDYEMMMEHFHKNSAY